MTAAVKGNRSDAEIKDIADRQGALVGQLAFIRAKAMAQLYAQLTPEQKTKAEAIRDRIKSRFTSIR
jgi:Spy/CpxP family protein refolding chaperone